LTLSVIWSDPAAEDLDRIVAYIDQFDTAAADRLARRLITSSLRLGDFPLLGKAIGRGLRQLSSAYPYSIRYRVKATHVEITAVRHGRRRG
jgi:plasmid stabilization system protein ParE